MLTSHIASALIAAFAGYLIGSLPFGLLLTRAFGAGDIRKIGSGNIGATNVLRTGRTDLALLTLLLDAGKGTATVLLVPALALSLAPTPTGSLFEPPPAGPGLAFAELYVKLGVVAGLGAFLGHLYPIWLRFQGGKGVATYIGVLFGLLPLAAAAFCAMWLVVAVATRYSSAAALAASAAVPPIAYALGGGRMITAVLLIMTVLLVWKHRGNIARLRAGTESRIGRSG